MIIHEAHLDVFNDVEVLVDSGKRATENKRNYNLIQTTKLIM